MKLGVWVVVFVCLLAAVVWGDEESDRKALIDRIDELLDGIAKDLQSVVGDSGTSSIDNAVRKANDIRDLVDKLASVKGNDDKAKRYAERYKGYADTFKEYAMILRKLKEGQKALDPVPSHCEDRTKELVSRMRAFTDNHDPRGLEEVPKLSREFGRTGKEALAQAERKRDEMYRLYDRTDDFSESDGKWSTIRSALASAGRGLWDYFSAKYDQVKRDDVCGNLAKEERNPLVEQAMKKLLEGKKGIEVLYTAIDDQLRDIASYMKNARGSSSTSDIDAAVRKAEEVARNIEQLDRIRGQDSEARRRVEAYRNILRAFAEASKSLRTLKQGQYLVDRAPEKCGETQRNLTDFIRKYTDRGDTAGLKLIPGHARELGESIKASLAKADDQHRQMEKNRSEVLRFDTSEGRWGEVASSMRESTNAIWDYWKRAWETAHKSCDELAKGDQHKDVLAALKELGSISSNAERELRELRDEHRKWHEELKQLREWYKQDTANVRQLFCSVQDSPGDTDVGDAYAAQLAQIADRMRDRIAPKWQDLTSRATKMVPRLQQLMKVQDEAVSKGATSVLDKLNRTMNSVTNVLRNELNGANDPEVRAQIEVGKAEHKRIQADSGKCHASEITIPGKGMRIDCVYVSSGRCTIYEIKPNNSTALIRGREQARNYKLAVEDYFGANKDRLKDAFTDKMSVFLKCIQDGKIELSADVRVYEFCPPDGKLFHDFVVPAD